MSLSKARKLIADGLYKEALSYIDEIIKTENYPLILQNEYKNLIDRKKPLKDNMEFLILITIATIVKIAEYGAKI